MYACIYIYIERERERARERARESESERGKQEEPKRDYFDCMRNHQFDPP